MKPSVFRFVGGNLAIDFVNTVDWLDEGLHDERLVTMDDLVAWAVEASLLSVQQRRRMRSVLQEPEAGAELLSSALGVRDRLHAVFSMAAKGRMAATEIEWLDRSFRQATSGRSLSRKRGDHSLLELSWPDPVSRPDTLLYPVIEAAVVLLSSPEASRIQVCEGEACGWLFVNRSRNGLRRWCEMGTCGTREKSRKRAASR